MKRPYQFYYKNRLFLDVFFATGPGGILGEEKVIPIILCNFGLLSKEEIEAGRRFLRRSFGKDVRVEVVVKAFLPQTKKPSEVRMGKGKGKIAFWVAPIRAGQVIYKLHGLSSLNKLQNVLLNLSKKFSKNLTYFDINFFQGPAFKLWAKEFHLVKKNFQ